MDINEPIDFDRQLPSKLLQEKYRDKGEASDAEEMKIKYANMIEQRKATATFEKNAFIKNILK